jgi:hypothetical protein
MNLKFKTHKLIDLDRDSAVEMTVLFLQKSNYNIVNKTTSSILFNDNDHSMKLSSDLFIGNRIDKGLFEFAEKNEQLEISLTYQFPIFIRLIQLSIIVIVSINMGFKVLSLSIILILVFIFKVQLVRNNFIGDIFR